MDKKLKKEWIIKTMNEYEDERIIDFLYGIVQGYINTKERKIENER